ncbi:oxysterol-binding protein 1 [Paragonimus westermani]|uniref:Oxysterol-binding protein 1 n=1 Tax=Paragonimus westermani TaxID=34504 RepID=A0A5J4P075_9TREM|nr:oxysterol-binding protein 1 [Paragonimus westermani]
MDAKASDSLRGYLYKWTNYLKGYQKRWFVLQDGFVSYYRNQAEMAHTCRGTINLANANVTSTGPITFLISNSSTQTFHLRAASDTEQKKWVSALLSAKTKALAFKKQGDDSDAYTEGDDEDEGKNSTISADAAIRLVNHSLGKLESKFADLQRHQEALTRKGDDLQRAILDVETAHDPSELTQKLTVARDRATVYNVVSLAMVNTKLKQMPPSVASKPNGMYGHIRMCNLWARNPRFYSLSSCCTDSEFVAQSGDRRSHHCYRASLASRTLWGIN